MNETAVFWGAIAAMAVAFTALAALLADAIEDGADRRSRSMGGETSRELEDLFLFIPPERLARIGLIGAAAAFLAVFTPFMSFTNAVSTLAGLGLGIAAGALVFMLPSRYVAFLRARRKRKFNEQLVDALVTMSNALRAGFSINQAFESVIEQGDIPISQEFGVCMRQMRVGMTFSEALASLDDRMKSDDLTLVVSAIEIARKTGGNLTEIFERISETIRGRMRIERRVRTLTAQGRMQGLVVSLMPLLLGGILTAMKPQMMLPFLASVNGMLCVGGATLLVAAGWFVIRRIVSIDV